MEEMRRTRLATLPAARCVHQPGNSLKHVRAFYESFITSASWMKSLAVRD